MRKITGWYVTAICILCAGSSAYAGSLPEILKTVDQQILAGSAQVESLEKQVRATSQAGGLRDDFNRGQVEHQSCQAVSMGDPGSCGLLENMTSSADGKTYSQQAECRALYWRLMQSRVLMTAVDDAPGARSLCMAMLTRPEMRASGVEPNAACDVYLRYAHDARQRVEKMRGLLRSKTEDAAVAEKKERIFMGLSDPAACRAQDKKHGWAGVSSCMAARAYRVAYAKKDVNLCGDSGFCRALMGQKMGACGEYADRATKTVSGGQLRSGLIELQRSLLELLTSLDSIEPRGLAAVVNRRKRVSGLQARCSRINAVLTGKSASTADEANPTDR